eukprot:15932656-Heterocapsa_arctica.AAC.1
MHVCVGLSVSVAYHGSAPPTARPRSTPAAVRLGRDTPGLRALACHAAAGSSEWDGSARERL